MTSTEEAVADDPAVLPPGLSEAAATALREQPTFATLLDPSDTTWTDEGPGRYAVLVAPDVAGVLDASANRFIPDDPEQVRLLLVERMAATVGETPVAGGGRPRVVDWTTLQITDETGGVLSATANTAADAADGNAVHAVQLSIGLALQPAVVAEQLVAGGAFEVALDEAIEVREAQAAETEAVLAEEAPAAEAAPAVDAAYLGGYYGESAFPFDGNNFVIDWTTWTHDQTTPDGTVGFTAHATTTDGTTHGTYAWFDPATGISIVRAEPLASAGAEDTAPDVDAAYLGGYYGTSAFPFDGNNFVIDWTTWTHDQTTPDGTVGFTAHATTTDGTTHDTYAWFDPATGISIVRAEPLASADDAAPAVDEPEADPRAEFEALTGLLRDRWRSAGNRLEELNGKAYDVHGWVEGEPGCELTHQSFDGEHHSAELGAHTEGDARPVTVLLRIRDAETVWVDREDDRY